MVKQGIMYNLIVGFKLLLITMLVGAVLLIPLTLTIGIGLTSLVRGSVSGDYDVGLVGLIPILIIPVQLILNGYFVNKFKAWIFK